METYPSSKYNALALYRAGNCYYVAGRYDKALECYNKSLTKSPDRLTKSYVLEGIGFVEEEKGNMDSAIDFYRKNIQNKKYGV